MSRTPLGRGAYRLPARGAQRGGARARPRPGTTPARRLRARDDLGARSGQDVDRIRQLEGALGEAAGEIALLVAQAEQDRVALLGDLAPLGRLEVDGAVEVRALGLDHEPVPRIAALAQVALGRLAQVGGPPADEED